MAKELRCNTNEEHEGFGERTTKFDYGLFSVSVNTFTILRTRALNSGRNYKSIIHFWLTLHTGNATCTTLSIEEITKNNSIDYKFYLTSNTEEK